VTDAAVEDLLRRARDELYIAKTLVRATRNHTKLQAAALADSEARIDGLIGEVETALIPTPEEAQEHERTEEDRRREEARRVEAKV
jgi:hypothetical protein